MWVVVRSPCKGGTPERPEGEGGRGLGRMDIFNPENWDSQVVVQLVGSRYMYETSLIRTLGRRGCGLIVNDHSSNS